jgi:hypothetical protein
MHIHLSIRSRGKTDAVPIRREPALSDGNLERRQGSSQAGPGASAAAAGVQELSEFITAVALCSDGEVREKGHGTAEPELDAHAIHTDEGRTQEGKHETGHQTFLYRPTFPPMLPP